ncbi:uncharacterized protein LOC142582758 [Dermacentor variabilis]|uniref:uncharacterized protein LOC142582758 n=1 Tax=Dermacentor variabilis TaxID=34621 RepID=UPI003F5CA153
MALRLACFASGRGPRAAASRTARKRALERVSAASLASFEISGLRRRHRLAAQPDTEVCVRGPLQDYDFKDEARDENVSERDRGLLDATGTNGDFTVVAQPCTSG